ncbi:hypothetical protein P9112_002444 [Eukaryota sp. TZLM1-RC]
MEVLHTYLKTQLTDNVKSLEHATDAAQQSQSALQQQIETLTLALSNLDISNLPNLSDYASKLSGIKSRVDSMSRTLLYVQERLTKIHETATTHVAKRSEQQ